MRATEPNEYGLLQCCIAHLKGAPREHKRRSETVSPSAEKKRTLNGRRKITLVQDAVGFCKKIN